MEFFKDEPMRTCRSCRQQVRNPNIDLGCAEWCQYADACLGRTPGSGGPAAVSSLRDRLIEQMTAEFASDRKRIEHALQVLDYADQIMAVEKNASGGVVCAAAILHDIGIREAERQADGSGGDGGPADHQVTGEPIARAILERVGAEADLIDKVTAIVASHHHPTGPGTREFKIIHDADAMVNLPAMFDVTDRAALVDRINQVFQTPTGRALARAVYLES